MRIKENKEVYEGEVTELTGSDGRLQGGSNPYLLVQKLIQDPPMVFGDLNLQIRHQILRSCARHFRIFSGLCLTPPPPPFAPGRMVGSEVYSTEVKKTETSPEDAPGGGGGFQDYLDIIYG